MTTTTEQLLDKYRQKCSITSDNQLASALGITRQAISGWRKNTSWPSEEHIHKMANTIGEEPIKWLVAIHAERASGPVKKDWLRLAKNLGWAASWAAMTIGLAVYTPEANASTTQPRVADNNGCSYTLCAYIRTPTRGLVHAETGFRRLFPMVVAS